MSRILLVDDDPAFRGRLTAMLVEDLAGVDIHASSTMATAIERGLAEAWAAVLLDIRLPDGSGLAILRALKAARPELPVIMVSSLPPAQYADAALHLGAFAYVSKDRVSQDLIPVLDRALRSAP